jgi:hypothetical protein
LESDLLLFYGFMYAAVGLNVEQRYSKNIYQGLALRG